jgi:uncharacterized membrane protein required for colicin V production
VTITDILLIVLLLSFAWNGYTTGFVMQVVRFVGVFVAYWAAKTYGPTVTPWLQKVFQPAHVPSPDAGGLAQIGNSIANNAFSSGYGVLSFALVFIVVLIITRIIGRTLDMVVSLPGLSLLNRVAGLFVGVVIGVLVLVVAVHLLAYLPNATVQGALQNSRVADILYKADISKLLFGK